MNLNIFIHSIYGMSEVSGPQTYTNPNVWDDFASTKFLRETGVGMGGV